MSANQGKRRYPETARSAAWQIINDWETGTASIEAIRKSLLAGSRLSARDRALVTELTQGVMRHRLMLDHRIDALLDKPDSPLPLPVYNLLRLGMYQIVHLLKIPARAAVNESVELVKSSRYRGLAPLVNAVMRKAAKDPLPSLPPETEDPLQFISLTTSTPRWLVDKLAAQIGISSARHVLQVINRPPALTLRVNTLKTNRQALLDELLSMGVAARPGGLSPYSVILESGGDPSSLAPFIEGRCTVQDEGAQLMAPLLAPAPGGLVLDACASPGGKSGHLAQIMEDTGLVVAADNSLPRVRMMRSTMDRLGINAVAPMAADIMTAPSFFREMPEKILLDVPCSGTGVLRRHPEGKWKKDPSGLQRITDLQFQMLTRLASMLPKGGELLYTTCSLLSEENEEIIDAFLEESPLVLDDLRKRDTQLPESAFTSRGEVRIWPHIHDCDGFYAALLARR